MQVSNVLESTSLTLGMRWPACEKSRIRRCAKVKYTFRINELFHINFTTFRFLTINEILHFKLNCYYNSSFLALLGNTANFRFHSFIIFPAHIDGHALYIFSERWEGVSGHCSNTHKRKCGTQSGLLTIKVYSVQLTLQIR